MHRRQPLPRLWMMTDERQGEALLPALGRMPPGSGLVFRHYSLPVSERRDLFDQVKEVASERDLLVMLAGDSGLAAEWGAGGWHGMGGTSHPGLLRSAPVHDLAELKGAEAAGADFLFVSPVFPTRSHPGAATLGPAGFHLLAREAKVPVIALGGMNAENAQQLSGLNLYGWAAIDAWME